MPSQPKSKTTVLGWGMPKALKKKQKAEKDKTRTSQESPAPSSSQRPNEASNKSKGNPSKGSRLNSNQRDENSFSQDSSIYDLSKPQVPANPGYSPPSSDGSEESDRSESEPEQVKSNSARFDEATRNDGQPNKAADSAQQNDQRPGADGEDSRPDGYARQASNAGELDWYQMSRKHHQAFFRSQHQYSHRNREYGERLGKLRASDHTERQALQAEFGESTGGLVESMVSTRNAANFCLIMNHHGSKDLDPRDRYARGAVQLPDQIQAAAIGTQSMNDELCSAIPPRPLPAEVIRASLAHTRRRASSPTTWTHYHDILFSQRYSIAKCLERNLSAHPKELWSITSDKEDCYNSFSRHFDVINANPGPWAPHYPPATSPPTESRPRSTASAQSGYTGNTQGSRQSRYGPSSSASPPDPGYPYSTSRGAPPQLSSSTSGHPESGYQSTNFPSSGVRDGTGGNSANYYSARRVDLLRRTQDADHDIENTKPAAKIR